MADFGLAGKFLLEGRPGVGKTTVANRLAALLREAGLPLSGFVRARFASALSPRLKC